MIQVYHNNRCGKSREAIKIVEASGKEFEIIKYLESKKDYSNLSNIYNHKYIFPGVEIGACDKAHIILVFNPCCTNKHFYKYDINGKLQSQKSWDEYISDFLTHIDIKEPRITNNNPFST